MAVCLACLLLAGAHPAAASVTAREAVSLSTSLTPTGAEREGNASGTIPAWTGGAATATQAALQAVAIVAERPLFGVNAANASHYAGQLPEGAKILFSRYPDYRMDVYPTHRTASLPQPVYDAIARNAVSAHPVAEGCRFGVANASGGIPYPIPHDGCEVVWNHILAYWGPARDTRLQTYVVFDGQDIEKTSDRQEIADFPYYEAGLSPTSVGPYYFQRRDELTWPADRAGGGYITRQPVNIAQTKFASWEYLPGERRVRKSPSLSYDTPNPDASGLESFDDYYIFSGGLDRYTFTLLGKREMIIPYNNHLFGLPASRILGPHHADPSALRYELHRVWIVDAQLAAGQHHIVPHRRLYIDEDSWFAVYADEWDGNDHLWKFSQGAMDLMPDMPAVILGSQFVYDLQYRACVYDFAFGKPNGSFRITPPHPESAYTPQGMATDFNQ